MTRRCGFAELAGPVFKEGLQGRLSPGQQAEGVRPALLSMQEDGDYGLLKQKWFSNRLVTAALIAPVARARAPTTPVAAGDTGRAQLRLRILLVAVCGRSSLIRT